MTVNFFPLGTLFHWDQLKPIFFHMRWACDLGQLGLYSSGHGDWFRERLLHKLGRSEILPELLLRSYWVKSLAFAFLLCINSYKFGADSHRPLLPLRGGSLFGNEASTKASRGERCGERERDGDSWILHRLDFLKWCDFIPSCANLHGLGCLSPGTLRILANLVRIFWWPTLWLVDSFDGHHGHS